MTCSFLNGSPRHRIATRPWQDGAMNGLEAMQRSLRGEAVDGFPMKLPPPVALLIGFEPVAVERGAAVFRLDARRDKHANPMGTLHGGILCDVAHAAMR